MPAKYPHEYHAVGNIPGCKHCHRMSMMLAGNPDKDCPARLRERIAELESQLAAKSEWEASQHKLAARVRGEERAAVVAWLRTGRLANSTLAYTNSVAVIVDDIAEAIEAGKHHKDPA